MNNREKKIEKLVDDQVAWDIENMRGSNEESIREHMSELSDAELDNALAMRCISVIERAAVIPMKNLTGGIRKRAQSRN